METGILYILSILVHFACTEREFVFVDKYLDWTSAQTYCREKFSDLVTVYNEKENQKLMSVAGNVHDCIWIGLRHKFTRPNNWRWIMGEPIQYYEENADIWANGEPDNNGGQQHCAAVSKWDMTGGLYDKTCTDSFPFICFNGSVKYIFVDQPRTWVDALAHCRTLNSDLASVTRGQELSALLLKLTATNFEWAWIGLYRDPWHTWSDSTNTSFYNWETQPASYHTDDYCGCLKPATGKWQIYHCTSSYRFICSGDVEKQTKQTILKVKMLSSVDLTNTEIQHQILEQMKNSLGSGEANLTVKWRATTKPATKKTVQIKCEP